MLRRLNPFRGLPNPLEVWAWGMYDLANQSFSILINTLFFAIYFTQHVAAHTGKADLYWGIAVSVSNLLVVIAGPVIGAVADYTGAKKQGLFFFYVLCVGFTGALGFVEPGAVLLGMLIYIGGNFSLACGENFLASFLPEISTRQNIGRISAIGWTMGYLGALLILPVTLLITGLDEITVDEFRRVFVLAAVWFLINAVPTFWFVKERKRREQAPQAGSLVAIGFSRLGQTARDAFRYRHLIRFLMCFFVYACGVHVVIYFAGIISMREFGFGPFKLTMFMTQLTVAAGLGAALTGVYQDRLGHRRTLHALLCVWAVSTLGVAFAPREPEHEWVFWVVSNFVGFGLGGIGTASRAMVGLLTPRHKTAEFFGLWGLAYKSAAVVGPVLFGAVSASPLGMRWALVMVSGFFVTGFVGLFIVDEREGSASADEAERLEASTFGPPPTEQPQRP
ncbi:MAG: MFS transporter [Phycisphaerales bacterium]|nr:MAG: MFS transporter [Phycisphaerales bacterium]